MKGFVRLAENAYKAYFPSLPNYANFLKAANRSFPFVVLLLQYFLMLNRRMSIGGVYFFDSTPLSVCANGNIPTHRVTAGLAVRGKTSKGWFFGFKLHGACDAGYLLRQKVFVRLFERHKRMLAAARKNMKRLMTEEQGRLLKKRSIIETL